MKPHIVLLVHGVRSASRPRVLTENTPNSWEMQNTFLELSKDFDDGCDRFNSWVNLRYCGTEKGWTGRLCDAEFPNIFRSVGLVKDQEPSTLVVAKRFDQALSIHSSDRDCNAKRLERQLGVWRTSEWHFVKPSQ